MNLHEHQAKEVLRSYGIPTSEGRLAVTPEEAAGAYREIGASVCAVKAQIHAGGRGKGGGIRLVKSADAARAAAESMLGKPLVTHQTGPKGKIVQKVWVEEGCDIDRELYLGVALDRKAGQPVMMACSEGGVEIEEVASRNPDAILRESFHVHAGLQPFQTRRLAFGLRLSGESFKQFTKFAAGLAKLYTAEDCSLVEINPLVVKKDGGLIALDAKMAIDDRALARRPHLAAMRDVSEEDPAEHEANQHGLSYVSMDGTIGCMVNGAGLAMATMDIIQLHGGMPANFLDVGGGATRDQVAKAFQLLMANESVKAVLINIFGGILHCDVLAGGIVQALKEVEVRVPVVVRLEGTNVEKGRRILAESGLKITPATDMTDAAKKVVEAAK